MLTWRNLAAVKSIQRFDYSSCIEGHLCVPYVQKTQQSPFFGESSVLQFSHVYFIWQTSVGNTSTFVCPHSGQVISDVFEFIVLLSFTQHSSFLDFSISCLLVDSGEH